MAIRWNNDFWDCLGGQLFIIISRMVFKATINQSYYSFKIFPRFWLAKSTRIIHHNQLLMTKFGRILCLTRKWRQKCSLLQVNAPLTEKTWGRGWVVFLVKTKTGGHFTRFKSKNYAEIIAKNMARTARTQLKGDICYLENICGAGQT